MNFCVRWHFQLWPLLLVCPSVCHTFKSPGILVRVPPPPPSATESCSHDNFWTTFQISFIFGRIDGPDLYITWLDFGRDLVLEFSRLNLQFAISLPKMVRLPWNKNQTFRLNSKPQIWHLSWPCTWPWPWIFKVKYGIHYIFAKNGPIVTKQKANISSLKCNHWIWPWLWAWPWIFKVKYGICDIVAKNGLIASKQKANILIEVYASNVTIDLTFTMTLTLNFQGWIWNLQYISQKWCDCYETKSKQTDWTPGLKCDHQNLLYLDQKWFDCHKMKSISIDWTEGLNDHQVWPWPWSWKVRCKDLPDWWGRGLPEALRRGRLGYSRTGFVH